MGRYSPAMNDSQRPLVLVSNDDGIDAPGLAALVAALDDLAEVRVVAPEGPQSGVGHAVTSGQAVRVETRDSGHAVHGTPADCARVALAHGSPLIAEWAEARKRRSIWLVSGINHGANLGVDLYVSGTAAAAREAAILGFPALAISQYVGRHRQPDWEETRRGARPVLEALMKQPPGPGAFWNVNLPDPLENNGLSPIVHCDPDPSPHPVQFEVRGEHYAYSGDFHARPRLPEHDVDVCFGGRIAVSRVPLSPASTVPPTPDP
ncbi:5'/3'-nucleotidase SurE [Myxococcota bacterium]|nr:5'/3'-nucleotidase SurE [Myxococcota bacterium]